MSDDMIPRYPVVHVTVQTDGSAHVNVAGKHVDYPPADLEVIRAEVITYAVDVAARLGRGVRMTTIDPDGEWQLGIYPNGAVVDLAPTPIKRRGKSKQNVPERSTEVATRPAPAGALAPMSATLTFSTGQSATIGAHAVIGRSPSRTATDPAGSQLVKLQDEERTVSRVHCDAGWIDGALILTDRASGNGTRVTRASEPARAVLLEPSESYELQDGDVLEIGTEITCTVRIDKGTP